MDDTIIDTEGALKAECDRWSVAQVELHEQLFESIRRISGDRGEAISDAARAALVRCERAVIALAAGTLHILDADEVATEAVEAGIADADLSLGDPAQSEPT
jgi:hypothetical protein